MRICPIWTEVSGALTAALISLSCGTSSTATLKTTWSQSESGFSTDIVSIDGRLTSRSSFELKPGRHVVEAVGTSSLVGPNSNVPAGARVAPGVGVVASIAAWASATESERMNACFIVRPGRTYEVRTYAEGGGWHIQVIDQTTTYDVQSPCKRLLTERP